MNLSLLVLGFLISAESKNLSDAPVPQVHADSLQDALAFNLLQELYVHTYMTKRAFSYVWARTPNLRRIKVGAFHMHGDLHARILSRLRDSLNLIPLGRDNFTQPRGNTFFRR